MHLLVDNYDSFTYNVVQALGSLGAEVQVMRNDALSVDEAVGLARDSLIISAGPARPSAARWSGRSA